MEGVHGPKKKDFIPHRQNNYNKNNQDSDILNCNSVKTLLLSIVE